MDDNSKISSVDISNVEEIVENAKLYGKQLQSQLTILNDTCNKLSSCAEETACEIETAFDSLAVSLLESIETRKNELLQQVNTSKLNALGPLTESKAILDCNMKVAQEVITTGQKIIDTPARILEHNMGDFYDASNGIGSLPEVPKPADVPSISVHLNPSAIQQITTNILKLGRISFMGPVQIIESKERPGALAIRWEEIDMETPTEFENIKYQLQCCQGSIYDETEGAEMFYEAYVGPDICCIVRNLQPNIDYSFRVCRYGNVDRQWSLTYVARTTIVPYRWDTANIDYALSDEDRIASKVTTNSSVLFSREPQFEFKHSLQFKVLECYSSQQDEGIGLSLLNVSSGKDIIQPGVILLNYDGCIFMDGAQMTTRLPKFFPGALIALESEELPSSKMRVTITCEGKQVTYDWRLDQLCPEDEGRSQKPVGIFFFMFFRDIGWKVRVD